MARYSFAPESCITSSHFAQKPGKGGRPAMATSSRASTSSTSGRPATADQPPTSGRSTAPASQNRPALAKRWLKNRPPTTSGREAVAPSL